MAERDTIRAAEALMQLDAELAHAITKFVDYSREDILDFIASQVMNTWTLTLAAQSAGVTEEAVIASMLHCEPIHLGTKAVCRAEAFKMFSSVAR
tara:strand:+ start:1607 stop:1891 length:285 start_codon:yes stop_codon:yes gene_type:complete